MITTYAIVEQFGDSIRIVVTPATEAHHYCSPSSLLPASQSKAGARSARERSSADWYEVVPGTCFLPPFIAPLAGTLSCYSSRHIFSRPPSRRLRSGLREAALLDNALEARRGGPRPRQRRGERAVSALET